VKITETQAEILDNLEKVTRHAKGPVAAGTRWARRILDQLFLLGLAGREGEGLESRYLINDAGKALVEQLRKDRASVVAPTPLERYASRMSPLDVWPAAHKPAEAAAELADTEDPHAEVLRWKSNGQCPMDDMVAAWMVLGRITREQAMATSAARAEETEKLLAAYRANPPQPDAEQLHEMRNAFGPGATVVNVITGQKWTV
jgi:hypothetical protein